MTKRKAPGKSHREGLSLIELMNMFPTEDAAITWFEDVLWAGERCCGHCGSVNTCTASHARMPYWCSDCRSYFSVRTGTAMQCSKIPLRKWAIGIYLCLTSLKSVSSMKLHRDLKVTRDRIRVPRRERDHSGLARDDRPHLSDRGFVQLPPGRREKLVKVGHAREGNRSCGGDLNRPSTWRSENARYNFR